MTSVSSGSTGPYEPYGRTPQPYGGGSAVTGSSEPSTREFVEPYGRTGVSENRCPRSVGVDVRANLARRARRCALCAPASVRRRSGVAA